MGYRTLTISVIFLLKPLLLFSQGLFHVHEYEPETYQNFRQNWSVVQDSSGYMFFGNSAGLIRYDGVDWASIHIPRGKIVRSMHRSGDRIYVGGDSDFGYLEPDSLNHFQFKSLRSTIDSTALNFTDVWKITEFQDEIYFSTREAIYSWSKDSVKAIRHPQPLGYLFKAGDNLLVNIENEGLSYVNSDGFEFIPGSESYADDRLYLVVSRGNDHLLISRNQGFVLFDGQSFRPFETEASSYVQENLIYRGTYINNSEIALATLSGGIVIINTNGDWIATLTEEDGLPTNIIYDVYMGNEGILWAATDNGLAKVRADDPFTRLDERSGLSGIPTFIETVNQTTYIGTTEGLFFTQNGNLDRFRNFSNRILDGTMLENQLLVSSSSGIYLISQQDIKNLTSDSYTLLASSTGQSDEFYGAEQQTVYKLKIADGTTERTPILHTNEPIRDLFLHNDEIWVPASGSTVYRLKLDEGSVQNYKINLPEGKELNQIGWLNKKIRLGTDQGLFVYNPQLDKFEIDSSFTDPEMTSEQVFRFSQCSPDEIWFRNNRKIKRAFQQDEKWEIIENPYRTIGPEEVTESIHCNQDGSIWFGGTGAVFHLSDTDWNYEYDFNTNITGVLVRNDSLIYGGFADPETQYKFSFQDNELRFNYAAASYIDPEANTYRTRLRGYEEDWSEWTEEFQKDYTFIPEGTYTFEVQARNVYQKTGSIDSFTFTIMPPWYRTVWAYIIYTLAAGGLIYGGYRLRLNTILREQRIRDGIARDLHDELSSTLSSINFFASAIEGKTLDPEKAGRFLSLISKSSSEAKEKISDIVWVIHSENDDWDNLLLRCKRFASDILEAKNINHSFNVKGTFPDKPDLRIRRNVWLSFREILTNIARHANPVNVVISIEHKRGKLHMAISDDGQGFDHDNIRDGAQGLQNIRTRIHQLRGHCSLESSPAEGTSWKIQIPL